MILHCTVRFLRIGPLNTVRAVDFETPVQTVFIVYCCRCCPRKRKIKRRKCCCSLVFQSLPSIQYVLQVDCMTQNSHHSYWYTPTVSSLALQTCCLTSFCIVLAAESLMSKIYSLIYHYSCFWLQVLWLWCLFILVPRLFQLMLPCLTLDQKLRFNSNLQFFFKINKSYTFGLCHLFFRIRTTFESNQL
jgi:hypothetical protein